MAKVRQFSPEDHVLVTSAVKKAEETTDGEIVTIVAEQSDHYADVAWAIAGLVALTALLVWSLFPDILLTPWTMMTGGWNVSDTIPMWLLFVFTALKFFGTRLILIWKPLRFLLTPAPIKRRRVAARANDLFQVAANHRTIGRTGILIYASMREHRAEIIAEQAIAEKVSPEVWGHALVSMIEGIRAKQPGQGMAEAVKEVGFVLTEHFPKSEGNPNELPDRLIEL